MSIIVPCWHQRTIHVKCVKGISLSKIVTASHSFSHSLSHTHDQDSRLIFPFIATPQLLAGLAVLSVWTIHPEPSMSLHITQLLAGVWHISGQIYCSIVPSPRRYCSLPEKVLFPSRLGKLPVLK